MTTKIDLNVAVGQRIVSAQSSLKSFSMALDNGLGISLDAIDGANGPTISVTMPTADSLAKPTEAVCAVDWSWIYTSTIKSIESDGSGTRVAFKLDPAGPLAVIASSWQGSAFLGFQPFKPSPKP